MRFRTQNILVEDSTCELADLGLFFLFSKVCRILET
jgi:hypothetical protein